MNKPRTPLEKYLEEKIDLMGEMYWITNPNLCLIDNDEILMMKLCTKNSKRDKIVNGFLREYKCICKKYRDVFANERTISR